jgi:hypothetical protein
MVWVWEWPQDEVSAEFDGEKSAPFVGHEIWSIAPLEPSEFKPVFSSKFSASRFKGKHCPKTGMFPCVDGVWKGIILEFVPNDRVQFFPVLVFARKELVSGYSIVIPFDRVHCIDEKRSTFTSVIERPDKTLYFGPEKIVHLNGCMGPLNLARDCNVGSHLVVSDALRNALAQTGESSMFFRPDSLPLY